MNGDAGSTTARRAVDSRPTAPAVSSVTSPALASPASGTPPGLSGGGGGIGTPGETAGGYVYPYACGGTAYCGGCAGYPAGGCAGGGYSADGWYWGGRGATGSGG